MKKLFLMSFISLFAVSAFAEDVLMLRAAILSEGMTDMVKVEEVAILRNAMNSEALTNLERHEKINLIDAVLFSPKVKDLEDVQSIKVSSAGTCAKCYEVEVISVDSTNKYVQSKVMVEKASKGYVISK